jgi:hypothetical protein
VGRRAGETPSFRRREMKDYFYNFLKFFITGILLVDASFQSIRDRVRKRDWVE